MSAGSANTKVNTADTTVRSEQPGGVRTAATAERRARRRDALPTVKLASTRKMKLREKAARGVRKRGHVAARAPAGGRTHPKSTLNALSSSLPRRSMKKTS